MNTVQDIYEKQVKILPVTERLQLARLIMDDLAESAPQWIIDEDAVWREEDLYDLSRASLRYATRVLAERDEDADSR
ncbi:MAG TPA: hypothetical protein VIK33_06855 [Anaerolineae bacterium]